MDFVDWMHETHRIADQPLRAALAAAEQGDAEACASAARETALFYLRRYLEVVGDEEAAAGDSVACLLEAAARHDPYFERLRAEGELLDAGSGSGASTDDFVDALKEIRFLAMARAGKARGFSIEPDESDPRLDKLLTHSTPVDRACSIFAQGAIVSFNRCAQLGMLSGLPVGAKAWHNPRRLLDFVMFHIPDNRYCAGEKVANSQRKGWVDEALEDDYQPSVRLFFRRAEIETLPGFDDDGLHQFMVRDEVSLDLIVCAVFPSQQAREEALARVREPERRERLAARCLIAPPDSCADPQSYVRATNEMVAKFL